MKQCLAPVFLSLFMMAATAHASTWAFSLTEDGCSGTCGAGPYGTATLVDGGADPPSAAPEPGSLSLLVLGGALVLAGLRRTRTPL